LTGVVTVEDRGIAPLTPASLPDSARDNDADANAGQRRETDQLAPVNKTAGDNTAMQTGFVPVPRRVTGGSCQQPTRSIRVDDIRKKR